jgi:hypothetical protein
MNRNRHRVQVVKKCYVILIKQPICRKVDHVGHPLCLDVRQARRDFLAIQTVRLEPLNDLG